MKVYLVKAGEWESDVRCVCATKEIAEREVLKIAKEYGVEDEVCLEDFIDFTAFEIIEA